MGFLLSKSLSLSKSSSDTDTIIDTDEPEHNLTLVVFPHNFGEGQGLFVDRIIHKKDGTRKIYLAETDFINFAIV